IQNEVAGTGAKATTVTSKTGTSGISGRRTEPRVSMKREAVESMEGNLRRGEPVILAAYGLIGAILVLGAAGFVVDRAIGSGPWGLLTGLLAGLCVGFVWLARVVGRS